jgi:hypothetical protein
MRKKGMFAAAAAFAVSPAGRRMIQQARSYLRSPEGRQKIAELRGRAQRTVVRPRVRQP